MSPVKRTIRALAVGCALLAVIAVGCSKKNGAPFDPDAGHSADFFPTHPAEYRSALESCDRCHGTDLSGGISAVSCYSAARDGQSCHPGGPGGHPAGWRALHSADPSQAATCAPCHDNRENNQAPNCFDNSLCHGPKSGHPVGWRAAHSRTNPSQASVCAGCHDNPANSLPPDCFNNSLCHGAKSSHPAGWRQTHTGTNPSQASRCAGCHDNPANSLPPDCFNNSLCHGAKSSHPAGWRQNHTGTNPAQASVCAGCHDNPANSLPPDCFNNSLCHGTKAGHPDGWSDGSRHGKAAEASPGATSGMGYCGSCHGRTFNGGDARSCLGCHGGNAPHPKSNWAGDGGRHTGVNTGNTTVCARCHSQLAGSTNCLRTNGCHESD